MIGGFVVPDSGTITIDGVDHTATRPERRPTAMVFQNYALWPHMTVFANVAFDLKIRKNSRAEITRKVTEVLELVGLSHHTHSRPGRISGGEQQRVAAAALAPQVAACISQPWMMRWPRAAMSSWSPIS
jgi:putative spermidine/putrescine transport system ATP-binding protein